MKSLSCCSLLCPWQGQELASSCCYKNNCFPQKSVLDLPLARGLPYPPKQNVGTSLHGQRPCLIQCMVRILGSSPLLCWAGQRILLFHGPVMCSGFSQALQQVQIQPLGQENENAQTVKKMTAILEKWKQSLSGGKGWNGCLGGQRHQSWFTTAAGWGALFPTVHNVLWLHSKGKMPLWFHYVYEEVKHGSFPFLSASVCSNFAAMPPVGIYDYLIHICLCDDLVEIKGELMLGSMNFWLATLKMDPPLQSPGKGLRFPSPVPAPSLSMESCPPSLALLSAWAKGCQ